MAQERIILPTYPDPREDPKSRSLNGGSYKVPLVVWGPKLGDLLSRSSRWSGLWGPGRVQGSDTSPELHGHRARVRRCRMDGPCQLLQD